MMRPPRWVKIIALTVTGLYAAYLLAANIILRTHLLRGWLSSTPDSLTLDYSSARSLFPGSVVLHDVRLRFQDDVVQMSVEIDRADVSISISGLTQHRASFRSVVAENVVYRMRQKLESLDGNEGRARAFPPIPGFPASPLAALQPPVIDKHGEPWTIDMPDVRASLREVWTMEYRFRGAATLSGGFHIEPGKVVYVLPSTMHTDEGVMALGDEDFIKGGDWTLEAALDPFAPPATKGVAVLRYLSVSLRQRGGVVTIASIGDTYLPANGTMAIAKGAGPIGIDVRLDHGVVQEGSKVTYQTDEAVFHGGQLTIASDLDAAFYVDSSGAAPRLVADVKSVHGKLTPQTEIRGVEGHLALHGVNIAEPIVVDSLRGALGSAYTPDLRAWNAVDDVHDAHIVFTGGNATVSAKGAYEGGGLEGRIETKTTGFGLASGPFAVVIGTGSSSTNVKATDVNEAITFPGARVDGQDIKVKLLGSEAEGMWLRVRGSDVRIATSGPTKTDAHLAIESGPGEPTTKLFTGLAHLPDVAASAIAGAQLEANVSLRVRPHDVAVSIDHAKDGVIEGAGHIHQQTGKKASGAFVVTAGKVSAGIDITNGTSIVPMATADWLREKEAKP